MLTTASLDGKLWNKSVSKALFDGFKKFIFYYQNIGSAWLFLVFFFTLSCFFWALDLYYCHNEVCCVIQGNAPICLWLFLFTIAAWVFKCTRVCVASVGFQRVYIYFCVCSFSHNSGMEGELGTCNLLIKKKKLGIR